MPHVGLSPDLAPIVALGVLVLEDVRVQERDASLEAPLAEAAAAACGRPEGDPHIAEVRSMYRRLGIDPTKTRPSSEALLRRVRRGEPLPRINTLVDVCNWCSLEFQVPYGLYDLDRIEGPIALRPGRPGEEYAGIRKEVVHVGGRPVLADAHGPFGNPTSDSARTMVTPATRRALIVVFAPRPAGSRRVEAILAATADRALAAAGGRETGRQVVLAAGAL